MQEPLSITLPSSSPAQGQERRRSPRYPIRLQASLLWHDHPKAIAVVVLNFCREGMFIALDSSLTHPEQGSPLSLSLTLDQLPSQRLPAKLVRFTDIGIGIRFDEPLSSPLFDSLLSQAKPANQPNHPDASQLLEFCLTQGKDTLKKTLQHWGTHLEERLVEAAEGAGNNREQTALFETTHALQQTQGELAAELEECYINKTRAFFSGTREEETSSPQVESSSLTLVDQNDFEDWLNMTETASRVEANYQDKLRPLGTLFAQTSSDQTDSISPPFFPTALCENLRLFLDQAGINDITARKIVYQTFTDALQPALKQILSEFEQAFHFELDETMIGGSKQTSPVQPSEPASSEKEVAQETVKAEEPTYSKKELTSHQQGVLASFWELANASRQRLDPVESTKNLCALADMLPSLIRPDDRWDSGDILKKLRQRAKEKGKHLPELDAQAETQLQTAGQFIEALSSESVSPTTPGTLNLVNRLQAPLLRLILTEPQVLHNHHSPAVELMNQIGEAESIIAGKSPLGNQLEQLTQTLAQQLLDRPEDGQATLQKANHTLHRLLKPALIKSRRHQQRLVEGYEGKQKIAQSRLAVFEALHQRLSKKEVPELITDLLDLGWYQLLVLSHLRKKQDDAEWIGHLEVIDRLVEWLEAKPEINLPEPMVKEIMSQVDTGLGMVCLDITKPRRLLSHLSACLLGPEQGTARRKLTKTKVDFKRFIDPQLLTKPPPQSEEFTDSLAIGDWIKIHRDGKNKAYKLVWIGFTPPLYLFIDPSGSDRLELSPRKLATLFKNHAAARICNLDLPLMDRATDRVLHDLMRRPYSVSADSAGKFIDHHQFLFQLKQALIQSGRLDSQHILCQLELGTLDVIATVCGQQGKETLIQQLTQRIQERLPSSAWGTQIRDDCLAFLLPDHTLEEALKIAKSLRSLLGQERFLWQDQEYNLDTHIGLVPFCWGDHPEKILLNANVTCRQARQAGRNQIKIYKEHDSAILKEKNLLVWAGKINSLFDKQQLFLRCQQIIPLNGDSPTHYEILVGAREDNRVLAPNDFIPALEHFRRSPDLDRWVIEETIRWMGDHTSQLETLGGFSINLSGHSLHDAQFGSFLEAKLLQHKDLIPKLTFEITETAAINSLNQASRFIRMLKRHGCTFSLDDFGTGYASYAYLKHLEFDYLKIDGSFIKDILSNSADEAIVRSINDIAHSLGLKTIAEYAETESHLAKLKALGIDYGQGYGIAKPMPLSTLKLESPVSG